MNRKSYIGMFLILTLGTGLWTGCSSSSGSSSHTQPMEIAATSGNSQTASLATAYAQPLVATVTEGGTPQQGVSVVFTAPSTEASGLFSNGTATYTATTGSDGTASASFTANAISGSYSVMAAVSSTPSASATFNLQNTGSIYSFNLNGLEATNAETGVANYYALAGSVVLSANGTVAAGEEDYNDGNGLTAVGASITGGALSINSSGIGTLTLQTNNTSLGVSGTETLAVQFVNSNHALIAQYDGSATSSGTLDAQTLTSAPSGSYAFTLSGVDPEGYNAYDAGGVLAVSGTSFTGTVDMNDAGSVTFGNSISAGTLTAPDAFGRGELSGLSVSGTPITVEYYVVGPEVLRLIVVDTTDSAIGSAFGQGSGTLADTAIGNSVFTLFGNPYASSNYVMVGQLNTSQAASPSTFSAVADATEGQNVYGGVYSPRALSGIYAVSDGGNGYGDLTIQTWPAGEWGWPFPAIASMGLYAVDPTLNVVDPNNTTSGLGGALLANMDENWSGGTGVVVPQTDTNTADFTGNYDFGWQDISNGGAYAAGEFDFVGQGPVSSGTDTTTTPPTPTFALAGTTELNDLFGAFVSGSPATYPSAAIAVPLEADTTNVGRYTLDYNQQSTLMSITSANGGSTQYFGIVAYQASGGLLFWSEQDWNSLSLGVLAQQGSLTGLPITTSGAKGRVAGAKVRKK